METLDMYQEKDTDEFLSRVKRYNTVCFRGMEMARPADGEPFVPVQLNTGHWGTNVYPGVRKVREGENSFMQNQDWAKKMILK